MSKMTTDVNSLETLRGYVHERLCRHENLVPEQFGLEVTPLTRKGALCGLQFSLRGPRSVRLGAVWAADHNQLYLYDARGERFHKETLSAQFDIQLEAA
ncbi:hypothetical protein [Schlesneria sp. DSM 10557]|uniref:hypothetical protein n=1 Tax=Schlesneria sp. DSM 10557 TaxID=3044399 RepID=UPI0035A0363B